MKKLTMEMELLITLENEGKEEIKRNIEELAKNDNYINEKKFKSSYKLDEKTKIDAKLESLSFRIKEKDLPFDFINKDYKIEVLNDKQFLLIFKGSELSEDFDFDYPKIKLSRKDLTVDFFNNTKEINTFYLDLSINTKELKNKYLFTSDYLVEVKNVKFYDESGETIEINQKTINNYNNMHTNL